MRCGSGLIPAFSLCTRCLKAQQMVLEPSGEEFHTLLFNCEFLGKMCLWRSRSDGWHGSGSWAAAHEQLVMMALRVPTWSCSGRRWFPT